MKTMITLAIAFCSTVATAQTSTTQVCESQTKDIQITVETVYANNGEASSVAYYQGADLKSVKGAGANYLKGSVGDMDNFQDYQLILLASDKPTSDAILIIENHVDRAGYNNSVEKLSCY